jgi:hypothetical protein
VIDVTTKEKIADVFMRLKKDAQKPRVGGRLTHGKTDSPEYRSWRAMHNRCFLPSHAHYAEYGGRGIKICDRWAGPRRVGGYNEGFQNFWDDMGPRPEGTSLDRINPNGDYEPGNCRWATSQQQNLNRRPFRKKVKYTPQIAMDIK